jgi:hypothetical protein
MTAMSSQSSDEPPRREGAQDDFAKGQDDPAAFPEGQNVGRFSEGEEEPGPEDAEKRHVGRFSEGEEELGSEDPDKHAEGSFADTEE